MQKFPTAILVILDGFGVNPDTHYNAVALANMPTWRQLLEKWPHTTLDASEHHVGLPPGFMGNSEVGHLNIGAGRIVYQDFSLISNSIQNGSFFKNPRLIKAIDLVKDKRSTLHLMGLVSDGGVHSHISHLMALLQLAKRQGVERVLIHAFTDGRDTSPTSGVRYLETLEEFLRDLGIGKIATVAGRFYAMDRDHRWERIEKAYEVIVCGEKAQSAGSFKDPLEYLRSNYNANITDEFIPPGARKGYRGIESNDAVIFFNFRADRARAITSAITQKNFQAFNRSKVSHLSEFVCMTPYDETLNLPLAFEKPSVTNTMGEWVSKQGGAQLRISETEKYAHVTYFFNGGSEQPFENEKRVLIPSTREVATYDLKPEMSAVAVTDALLKELNEKNYQLVVVNFANPDMVGHTGNIRAAIVAVEAVDSCIKRIIDWVENNHAIAMVTSDHGNCELMQDSQGLPITSHTLFPVPLVVIDASRHEEEGNKLNLTSSGRLCDIAPTLLALWGVDAPMEMTGHSLISK